MVSAGRYSRVSRRISAQGPNAQSLLQRLLTGPELTCIPGLFPAYDTQLASALNWPLKAFREAFAEVFAEGIAEASWEHGLVYVPKAIRHNPPASPNVIKSWVATFLELPECELRNRALLGLNQEVKALSKAFQEAFKEAFKEPLLKASLEPIRKACPNQEQEQEQDLPIDKSIGEAPASAHAPKEKPRNPKRSRFVPKNFAPTDAHRDKAKKLGVNLETELELFMSHEHNPPKSDFGLAFHKWLTNAGKWQSSRRQNTLSAPERQPRSAAGYDHGDRSKPKPFPRTNSARTPFE